MNNLKEIEVTDSYLGMDEKVRGCQNEETFVCSTRQYVDTFLSSCGCLPLHMRLKNEVKFIYDLEIQLY